MKNKKAIFVLTPLVLLVWGLIAFKIFNGKTDKKTRLKQTPLKSAVEDTVSLLNSNDYHLHIDYRDPFLGKFPVQKKRIAISPKVKPKTKRKKIGRPVINEDWPKVVYGGRILNQTSEYNVAILQVDELERLVREKDELQGITVNEIYKDSIKVSFNNATRVFHKLN